MTTTDDRLAALAARRATTAGAPERQPAARTRRRHPAQGARLVVAGLSAAGVLAGVTTFALSDRHQAAAGTTAEPLGSSVQAPPSEVRFLILRRSEPDAATPVAAPIHQVAPQPPTTSSGGS